MSETTGPIVSVSASVQQEAVPDRFSLTGRASGRGDSSAAAAAALVEQYAALVSAVAGLPDSIHVRHGAVHIHEDFDGKRRTGWWAQRAITLEGRDPGTVTDAATALGSVADVAVDGPHWQVSFEHPVHAELQAAAVFEARHRAERYAAALDGALGALLSLSDLGSGGMVQNHSARMMRSPGAMPAAAGGIGDLGFEVEEQTVHASVNATWYLVLPG